MERRRRERQAGDFIAAAGKMRRVKTPEELILQAAMTFSGQVEKYGMAVVVKALELLPSHLREDAMRQIAKEETV